MSAPREWLFAIADGLEPESGNGAMPTRGNWPQWRGPNRDNRSSDRGLLQEWPPAGPDLVWRVDGIGTGIASVSIADKSVYTLGYDGGSEYVVAIDQNTAQRRWITRIGPETKQSPLMRWLSQRSPTIDGQRLYAVTADGDCVCLSSATGEEIWRVQYTKQFDAKYPMWGFCDRPLIDDNRLVCVPGGNIASVTALDKVTGKVIWQTLVPNAGQGSYGGTLVVSGGDVSNRQYLVVLGTGLFGVRASDGQLLWRYDPKRHNFDSPFNSYTPIARGNVFYHIKGGLNALKLEKTADEFKVNELFVKSLMLDHFQDSTVVVEDRLYTFKTGGLPLCVNLNTGIPVWGPVRTEGRGNAAISYADNRLYTLHSDGRMTLVEPSREGYMEKGHFQIPDHEPSIGATFPVITGGRLYVRDDNHLFCYEVRREAEKHESLHIHFVPPSQEGKSAETEKPRSLRSVFVPTPRDVVAQMLELAKVQQVDAVYDLGSGDGRIVIMAAKKYGCRAVGYEIERDLVESSQKRAANERVQDLVSFRKQDLFTADLSDATVVALYLLPNQLEKLIPQLEKLKPGSRIVSHQFPLPGCTPDDTMTVESQEDGEKHTIYLWRIPLKRSTREK